MKKTQGVKIVLKLINDERKNKRILSAKASNMYDYCPGTSSDLGMCAVGAYDRCTSFDWGDCAAYATDLCKYDYDGCGEHMTDECTTDYETSCEFSDYCYTDSE